MVGCSTYLRDEVGDILDVSAPAGDFMLTPSAPRFPWIAPGPASRPSCARRAQCADTATATSDGGPPRTVPLKIMRFARWASARQLQLRHLVSACGSRRHLLSPRPYGSCRGRAGPPYTPEVFGADLPGRQGRLSRSPQSLERIERFYDGRQAEPLLLDPGLHSAPLSRSLTLRERAKLTGLARSGDMETPVSLPGRLINGRTGALFVTSAR
jgi:hypothetical protein